MARQLPVAAKRLGDAFGAWLQAVSRTRSRQSNETRFRAAGETHFMKQKAFVRELAARRRLAHQMRLLALYLAVFVARRRVAPSRFPERLTLVSAETSVDASNTAVLIGGSTFRQTWTHNSSHLSFFGLGTCGIDPRDRSVQPYSTTYAITELHQHPHCV